MVTHVWLNIIFTIINEKLYKSLNCWMIKVIRNWFNVWKYNYIPYCLFLLSIPYCLLHFQYLNLLLSVTILNLTSVRYRSITRDKITNIINKSKTMIGYRWLNKFNRFIKTQKNKNQHQENNNVIYKINWSWHLLYRTNEKTSN